MKPLRWPRMDFIAGFLNSRTLREKQMIIGFLVALLFIADYALLLSPVLSVLSSTSPKIGPLREELKGLRDDYKNREEIRKKWEDAKKDIEERNQAFIAPDETPVLLENLSKEAQRSGVKIMSLEPSEGTKSETKTFYYALPIEMKAVAGTHEFGQFLSYLESGKTFFRVKDLQVASNPQNERRHQFHLFLEAYRREK